VRCPFCGVDEDKVIDSRQSKDAREIRRRRECTGCSRRFTTYERVEEALPMVVKNDGRREPFDRNKIIKGLKHAVDKRPVPTEALGHLAEEVEQEVAELGISEVTSRRIGELVLPRLRALDEVSYVRFASIYRDFRDIDEFIRELGELIKKREGRSKATREALGDLQELTRAAAAFRDWPPAADEADPPPTTDEDGKPEKN
jgi:transcriptional repressor NrdR